MWVQRELSPIISALRRLKRSFLYIFIHFNPYTTAYILPPFNCLYADFESLIVYIMSNAYAAPGAVHASEAFANMLETPATTKSGTVRRNSFQVSLREQKGYKLTTTINYDPDK
jgi:hypothetical protein